MTDPATTHAAYARCQSIVQTSGSSFAAGIRLLPAPKRRAITAIYALARRIDDIADGGGSDADRIAALAAERDALAGVGPGGDLVHIALADAAARFPLPLEEFGILIDGAEADVRNDGHETFDDLERYCRQVAGSIGRLSLAVFGCSDPISGATLADELGVGLQIANIVRDLREDAQVGRVYLPRADLARFDCSVGPRSDGHRGVEFVGQIDRVVRYEAFRALERLTTGLGLTTLLDRRSASCVIAMAGKYRRLLERIVGDPGLPLRGRLELRGWEKGLIVAESLAGRR